jgi:hypothetical protein
MKTPLRGLRRAQSSRELRMSESRVFKFERDWNRPNLVAPAMTVERSAMNDAPRRFNE